MNSCNGTNDHHIIRLSCFLSTLILVLASCVPLLLFPDESEKYILGLFKIVTTELGWIYMLVGLFAFAFILWLAFGPLAHKRVGESIEYSTFTWLGMLFCAGVGAGIMFGGSIDWAYYMSYPILGKSVGSFEIAQWTSTYGIFHWGPICWSIYAILAVPIAYSYYVKKIPVLNISQSCSGVLGEKVNAWPGKIIDIFFMTGLVAGSATALGLGIPIVTAGIASITGIEHNFSLELVLLFAVSVLFATSSYFGLKRGLSKLSEFNVYIAILLLLFVLVLGPTRFLIEMAIGSLGRLVSGFIQMSTWIDPAGKNGFTQNWTVFYYAWFVAYSPFMSLFIARISRGRTVRQIVLGPVIMASLGCGCFYLIFGNFGLHLQLTGQLNVVELIKEIKGATAIMHIADFLPFSSLYKGAFALVTAISMATTFDAVSFALAAATTTHLPVGEDPARWNRLFWALVLAILPAGILYINGPLSILQSASILAGFPVLLVIIFGVFSFLKDYQKNGWLTSQNNKISE